MTWHKIISFLLTSLIIIVMLAMMGLIGLVIGGVQTVFIALLLSMAVLVIIPTINPLIIVRLYGAKPLLKYQAPELYHYLNRLCDKAGLTNAPQLFLIKSQAMFAFTLGRNSDTVIVLSYGVINKLDFPEIIAVMAHETAHIMNRDLWLMSLTDLINRLMAFFSFLGQMLVLMFLPAYLFWEVTFPWLGVAILILTPIINTWLQFWLSRIREYDADYTAAYLMGTPRPLATALQKIHSDERYFLQKFLVPKQEDKIPSLFQTHPKIEMRIEKLLSIKLPQEVHRMF